MQNVTRARVEGTAAWEDLAVEGNAILSFLCGGTVSAEGPCSIFSSDFSLPPSLHMRYQCEHIEIENVNVRHMVSTVNVNVRHIVLAFFNYQCENVPKSKCKRATYGLKSKCKRATYGLGAGQLLIRKRAKKQM